MQASFGLQHGNYRAIDGALLVVPRLVAAQLVGILESLLRLFIGQTKRLQPAVSQRLAIRQCSQLAENRLFALRPVKFKDRVVILQQVCERHGEPVVGILFQPPGNLLACLARVNGLHYRDRERSPGAEQGIDAQLLPMTNRSLPDGYTSIREDVRSFDVQPTPAPLRQPSSQVTGHQVEYERQLLAHSEQCSQQRVGFQYAAIQELA